MTSDQSILDHLWASKLLQIVAYGYGCVHGGKSCVIMSHRTHSETDRCHGGLYAGRVAGLGLAASARNEVVRMRHSLGQLSMLDFRLVRGRFRGDPFRSFANLLADLPAEYVRVLQPAVSYQAGLLGVDAEGLQNSAAGAKSLSVFSRNSLLAAEVFVYKGDLIGLGVARTNSLPQSRRTERGQGGTVLIGHLAMASNSVQEFEQLVIKAFSTELERQEMGSPSARSYLSEGRTCAERPTELELAGARILRDSAARTLMQGIKAGGGGLLVNDLHKQLAAGDRARTNELRQQLIDSGLLDTETVVVCRKTSSPVVRYSASAAEPDFTASGIRCSCGRDIAAERREESLSPTTLGRTLVDKSRWLSVLLLQALLDLDVPIEHIFIEQTDGGDEMDCIAIIAGDTVLFELKDKQFSLGHAYSFAAKVGVLRPDVSVIVSTEPIGGDAKDHFDRTRRANSDETRRGNNAYSGPIFIECVEDIDKQLEAIGDQLSTEDAAAFFEDLMFFATIHPSKLMPAFIAAAGKRL